MELAVDIEVSRIGDKQFRLCTVYMPVDVNHMKPFFQLRFMNRHMRKQPLFFVRQGNHHLVKVLRIAAEIVVFMITHHQMLQPVQA